MAVSKEFEKSFLAGKDTVKRWNKAKKATPKEGGTPDIPSGNYRCRVTAEAKKTENGGRVVLLRNTIVDGEYKGKSWVRSFFLDGDKPEKVEQNWDFLSQALQVICDVEGADLGEPKQLISLLNQIDEQAPLVRVGVQRREAEVVNPKTKKKEERTFLNTYYNELLEDSEEEEEEEEDDENESEDDEDESSDESDEEEAGEGEEESTEEADDDGDAEGGEDDLSVSIETAEVGEYVWYKPKGKRQDVECQIMKVNKRGKTVDLKESEGDKTYLKVNPAELEYVEEE